MKCEITIIILNFIEQVNGEAIANEIVRLLEKANLDVKNCRGQGYDGASSMLSEAVGVQARIKQLCEKAVYIHCCGHSLSLVVVTACKLPIIRNGLDTVKEVSRMFVKGSKKMTLLKEVVHQNPHFSRRQKVMFDVCVTGGWKTWMVSCHLPIYRRDSRSDCS